MAVTGWLVGRTDDRGVCVTLGGTPIGREILRERLAGYPGGSRHTGWRCRLAKIRAVKCGDGRWQLVNDHPAWEPVVFPYDAAILGRVA